MYTLLHILGNPRGSAMYPFYKCEGIPKAVPRILYSILYSKESPLPISPLPPASPTLPRPPLPTPPSRALLPSPTPASHGQAGGPTALPTGGRPAPLPRGGGCLTETVVLTESTVLMFCTVC